MPKMSVWFGINLIKRLFFFFQCGHELGSVSYSLENLDLDQSFSSICYFYLGYLEECRDVLASSLHLLGSQPLSLPSVSRSSVRLSKCRRKPVVLSAQLCL